ncbi:MAG: DUF4416 family protein [Deltaproteobacteria bacterium]|nr:DUF4416 family protein [Deltaproteobacteria bacterium]
MSVPKEAERVKLICSIFSSRGEVLDMAIGRMEDMFGPLDWKSEGLFFDRTRYYENEMGWPLLRRFVTFRDLIDPEAIVEVKLRTNELEKVLSGAGRRSANIDPGYLCMERLVLVTGKNYSHRIYLSKGIYADLTLVFRKGCFRALPWTYRDYSDEHIIAQFDEIRGKYKAQLRGKG